MIQEKDCEIKAKVLKKIFQIEQDLERFQKQPYFISLAKERWQSPIYSEIKSAFNIKSSENKMLGRENQIEVIKNFLQSIVTYRNTRKPQLSEQKFQKKVLIIQGLPKTGKTHIVKKFINQVKVKLQGKSIQLKQKLHIHLRCLIIYQNQQGLKNSCLYFRMYNLNYKMLVGFLKYEQNEQIKLSFFKILESIFLKPSSLFQIQFTQKQKNLEECFSIVCRMILRRQWQIRNQVYNKINKKNLSIEDHQSFTKYETIIKGTQPFSKQQVLNAIHQQIKYSQAKNKDNLVDDFLDFPQSYKVVLICMFNFFRIRRSQYPRMRFTYLYQVLRRNHIKGQKQLWQIIYDLRSLGLIRIVYEKTRQLVLKINKLQHMIDLKIKMKDMMKIIKIIQKDSTIEFKFYFDCLKNQDEERSEDSQDDDYVKYQQDSQQDEKEDQFALQDKIFTNPIKIEELDQPNV